LRSIVRPKLKSEFESIKLLESLGVPVVRCLGWGANGSESVLITESVPGSVDARTRWFAEASIDPANKRRFLAGLADFLNTFLDAGVEHPDLHPGNILVSFQDADSKPSFTLVDVYGVVRSRRSREEREFDALSVVGGFRGEMTDEEGISFIEALRPEGEPRKSRAADVWRRLLADEMVKAKALWRKREPKLLSDPRYSRLVELSDGRKCRIRISLAGLPMLDIAEVEAPDASVGRRIAVERIPRGDAKSRWIHSSLLEIYRLPHNRVVGWIENASGEDELFVESGVSTILSEGEVADRYALSGLDESL
jgi:hypothetical protein